MNLVKILRNIILEQKSDPKNPNSYPTHDEWSMQDWKTFYDALIKKWGKENDAKKQFLRYWEPIYQSWLDEPAEDELDDESTGFKDWFKQKEMWNGPENRPYTEQEFKDVLRYKEKYGNNQTGGYATRCSSRAIDFIKGEEGFVDYAYDDREEKNPKTKVVGKWNKIAKDSVLTIGYGQTKIGNRLVKPGDTIDEPSASVWVENFINKNINNQLLSLPGHDKLTQQQFDALCSLTYNLANNVSAYNGTNLQKTISANPNSPNVKKHFTTKWEPLTLERRKREYKIYSEGKYEPINPVKK